MERRKCRRCGHPMTRMLTNDAGRWSACYTCLNCGCETATVTAKSETAAEDGLERFMDRVDRAHEADRRSAAPRKPQTAEADRALAAYGLYCQLCEALTGKPIAKLDELLTAALHRAEPELRPLTLAEALELGKDEDSIVYIESRRFGGCGWYQPCAIIFDSSAEGKKTKSIFMSPETISRTFGQRPNMVKAGAAGPGILPRSRWLRRSGRNERCKASNL